MKAGWGASAILFLTTLHVLAFGQDLDTLSFIMALFIPAIGTVNLVYAVGYMEHSHTQWRFYAFFLLMTGGLLGVAASSGSVQLLHLLGNHELVGPVFRHRA